MAYGRETVNALVFDRGDGGGGEKGGVINTVTCTLEEFTDYAMNGFEVRGRRAKRVVEGVGALLGCVSGERGGKVCASSECQQRSCPCSPCPCSPCPCSPLFPIFHQGSI